MGSQKKRKYTTVSLGALSALLGSTAVGAHTSTKKLIKVADLATAKGSKIIRNVSGVGAIGTGLGALYMANKYHKIKGGHNEGHR